MIAIPHYDTGLERDRERHEAPWVSGIESAADELLTDELTAAYFGGEVFTELCGARNDEELLKVAREYRDKALRRRREAVEKAR